MKPYLTTNRRAFIKTTATLTAGLTAIPTMLMAADTPVEEGIHIIGPKEGFSPQIGTLVSMMNWMRDTVLRSVKGLKQEELDYLHDAKSNTIGAMLLHLAATEVFYQGNTFEGLRDFKDKATWSIPMSLGEQGRKTIKGHDLAYYVNILTETREKTLTELRKRDDKWLMTVDPKFFGGQPTNNYCKWFHVVEHESNHNGQIKYIKGRLPGATGGGD
ncbi:DinB family protein [Longitalea luteola]|uniref:DinB family protein n=1 Tax=Longitalea luteola TaxID=2812563 RepID=UPI001A96CE96|nr:DinB family protein [Longitalea luteola]